MTDEFPDFHDIVLNYLPKLDKKIPWKNKNGKVKWKIDRRAFFIDHQVPEYEHKKSEHEHKKETELCDDDADLAQSQQADKSLENEKAPMRFGKVTRSHTELFRSTYRNTTDEQMEYTIDQTRRTVTSVSSTITKGIRFGGSFELGLTPPSIPSLKLGLHSEVEFKKDTTETKEEETSWTFQTKVTVPKRKAVRATLSVLEERSEAQFTVKSYFSGKIIIDWEYKKKYGQVHLTDLRDLLYMDGRGHERKLGFEADKKGIYFETKGICVCHYGLEQDVILREIELDESDVPRDYARPLKVQPAFSMNSLDNLK